MYYDVKVKVRCNLNIRVNMDDNARIQDICSTAINALKSGYTYTGDEFEWPIKPDDILYVESLTFSPVIKP
jgi:hypothetical protein